ncbi:hypothetical protein BD309DRAFT_516878 [Dichomitus squalens]|uniref:C2H2-type domain-containing protein n=1 Tax=Dichomitus squalens TaxID=114155 RepID=A0A4Q9Q6N2_9APHY|nr:hypothetical protein BD311DRAFT_477329 [Dichomitus squalens]TBU47215.1 hypothetical protein BD309DRAFT_516878 [Dichomitus squalens]TBU63147.1 hypothetical protein BD310DRAFT_619162 [Dichomitus squalens]
MRTCAQRPPRDLVLRATTDAPPYPQLNVTPPCRVRLSPSPISQSPTLADQLGGSVSNVASCWRLSGVRMSGCPGCCQRICDRTHTRSHRLVHRGAVPHSPALP